MIKIEERDFYEASYFIDRIRKKADIGDTQFNVMMIFVEGVINLMRRNYN